MASTAPSWSSRCRPRVWSRTTTGSALQPCGRACAAYHEHGDDVVSNACADGTGAGEEQSEKRVVVSAKSGRWEHRSLPGVKRRSAQPRPDLCRAAACGEGGGHARGSCPAAQEACVAAALVPGSGAHTRRRNAALCGSATSHGGVRGGCCNNVPCWECHSTSGGASSGGRLEQDSIAAKPVRTRDKHAPACLSAPPPWSASRSAGSRLSSPTTAAAAAAAVASSIAATREFGLALLALPCALGFSAGFRFIRDTSTLSQSSSAIGSARECPHLARAPPPRRETPVVGALTPRILNGAAWQRGCRCSSGCVARGRSSRGRPPSGPPAPSS